jgi:hypothetical protein
MRRRADSAGAPLRLHAPSALVVRTLLHERPYAQAYGRSVHRTRALSPHLRFYNTERRHTALQFLTPLQRLAAKQ